MESTNQQSFEEAEYHPCISVVNTAVNHLLRPTTGALAVLHWYLDPVKRAGDRCSVAQLDSALARHTRLSSSPGSVMVSSGVPAQPDEQTRGADEYLPPTISVFCASGCV
jgi:hypothetical protein